MALLLSSDLKCNKIPIFSTFAESTNVFYFGVLTVKFQNKELKYVRSLTFCESQKLQKQKP